MCSYSPLIWSGLSAGMSVSSTFPCSSKTSTRSTEKDPNVRTGTSHLPVSLATRPSAAGQGFAFALLRHSLVHYQDRCAPDKPAAKPTERLVGLSKGEGLHLRPHRDLWGQRQKLEPVAPRQVRH